MTAEETISSQDRLETTGQVITITGICLDCSVRMSCAYINSAYGCKRKKRKKKKKKKKRKDVKSVPVKEERTQMSQEVSRSRCDEMGLEMWQAC